MAPTGPEGLECAKGPWCPTALAVQGHSGWGRGQVPPTPPWAPVLWQSWGPEVAPSLPWARPQPASGLSSGLCLLCRPLPPSREAPAGSGTALEAARIREHCIFHPVGHQEKATKVGGSDPPPHPLRTDNAPDPDTVLRSDVKVRILSCSLYPTPAPSTAAGSSADHAWPGLASWESGAKWQVFSRRPWLQLGGDRLAL